MRHQLYQPLVSLLFSGCLASAIGLPALAKTPLLVAQQLTAGNNNSLPPNTIKFGQPLPKAPAENTARSQLPLSQMQGNPKSEFTGNSAPSYSIHSQPLSTAPAANAAAPNNNSSEGMSAYRVDINGSSRLLLQQVQKVAPNAFIIPPTGTIQAGIFAKKTEAEQLVKSLATQGIKAQIQALANSNANPPESASTNAFFTIVPVAKKDLPRLVSEVIQLGGAQANAMTQDNAPESHIAVGPFATKAEAEQWSSFLRSYGMNARVFAGN